MLRQEQVLGFDVAVYDASGMCCGPGLAGLHYVFDRDLDRQRAALSQHVGQVLPGQMLHDDEGYAVRQRADVEDTGHVLTADLGRRAGFAREALDQLGDLQGLGAQELQRHDLAQLDVHGRHDVAHATRANQLQDFILARDDVAHRKRQLDRGRLCECDQPTRRMARVRRAANAWRRGSHAVLPTQNNAHFQRFFSVPGWLHGLH